jgi:hypothetical protein
LHRPEDCNEDFLNLGVPPLPLNVEADLGPVGCCAVPRAGAPFCPPKFNANLLMVDAFLAPTVVKRPGAKVSCPKHQRARIVPGCSSGRLLQRADRRAVENLCSAVTPPADFGVNALGMHVTEGRRKGEGKARLLMS